MTTVIGILIELIMLALFPPQMPGTEGARAVTVQDLPAIPSRPAVLRDSEIAAPNISARAAGVWDPATETFLYEKEGETSFPIASITKLMTALVALEADMDLERTVTITSDDNDPEGSRLPIPNGGIVSIRDLFAATLVASANNAAEALVRATGMSEAAFVSTMNERASALGMSATHFTDVTGLGNSNTSCVRDLILLANEAFSHSLIADLTTTKTYDILDRASEKHLLLTNTNVLVGSDLRVLGGKTGYTEAANGALIARVRGIGEHDLVAVVLESDGRNQRFKDLRALVDWAFAVHKWPGEQ